MFKTIFQGSYGKVYQLRDKYSNYRAVKVITFKSLKTLSSVKMAVEEVSIMRRLNHENIVKFIYHTKDHLRSMIVMEFCSNKVSDIQFRLSDY